MARSRRSSSPARKAPTTAPAKKSQASAPAPTPAAPQQGGMMSGLLGTVVEGMAWGTGTSIARHAVNAAIDSFSGDDKATQSVAAAPSPQNSSNSACFNDHKALMDCLTVNKNDISACQMYLDSFNTCKQQGTQSTYA